MPKLGAPIFKSALWHRRAGRSFRLVARGLHLQVHRADALVGKPALPQSIGTSFRLDMSAE